MLMRTLNDRTTHTQTDSMNERMNDKTIKTILTFASSICVSAVRMAGRNAVNPNNAAHYVATRDKRMMNRPIIRMNEQKSKCIPFNSVALCKRVAVNVSALAMMLL